MIDLRSDTLTRPTPGMLEAMARAEVGDDVYGEDPTVNRLERTVAEMLGHEAGLFVASGTMGNQLGLRVACPPGHEVLCEASAHIVTYELGAAAAIGGLQTRTVVGERGLLDPDRVAEQTRGDGWGMLPTGVIEIENTHNNGGGAVYPLAVLERLRAFTRDAGVALHCDGARLWNAHVATGVPLSTYGSLADTLSVCLSKGLGAPVGSVLVGGVEQVARARVLRKQLGGGWRQAGVLAAAGLYALEHHMTRLADDHARARRLAETLADAAPGCVDPAEVETNIVIVDVSSTGADARAFLERARESGVLLGVKGPRLVRAVTHLDVDDRQVDQAAAALAGLLRR